MFLDAGLNDHALCSVLQLREGSIPPERPAILVMVERIHVHVIRPPWRPWPGAARQLVSPHTPPSRPIAKSPHTNHHHSLLSQPYEPPPTDR